MTRLLLLFSSIVLCFSCDSTEKVEYYEDGSIKSRFKGDIENGSGEKVIYERDGGVRKKDFFVDNQIDSSAYYFNGRDNFIRESWAYNDSTVLILKYNMEGEVTKQGRVLTEDTNFKIGKWVYSDHSTKMDSIVEYIDINNKSYANQIWLRTYKGDTIYGRGNYIDIYKKDTAFVEEVVRVQFTLMEPSLGVDSDIIIVIPKRDDELNDDYSNIFDVERDTLHSIKNDGIPRQGIPKEMPINHIAEFGIQYGESGKRRIRGALIEYIDRKSEAHDSINFNYKKEKKLFFNDSIFVRNTVNSR